MKPLFSALAAGIVALSATLMPPRAEAAQVAFDLTITAAPGSVFAGTVFTGEVYYDEALIPTAERDFITLSKTGVYDSTVDPSVGLYFDAGLYRFTELDTLQDPVFTFVGGLLRSINFIVTYGSSRHDLVAFGVEQFSFDLNTPITFDPDTGKGTYSALAFVKPLNDIPPVPLPAGLPLLAGGLGLMALVRRLRKA